MSTFWTAMAILAALVVQTLLSHAVPAPVRVLDPFLIVVVYCGLSGGETHGMLAGMAAGWVQDVQFGGPVIGLGALGKVLVGFVVGLAGTRFHLSAPLPRAAVLALASLADSGLYARFSALFDLAGGETGAVFALGRALVTALVGVLVYQTLERRLRVERLR